MASLLCIAMMLPLLHLSKPHPLFKCAISDLPGIINWLMLTHKSLQHATLATLRPGGGFEITSYTCLIKFLAKGHSSPLSLYGEETVIFFFQL